MGQTAVMRRTGIPIIWRALCATAWVLAGVACSAGSQGAGSSPKAVAVVNGEAISLDQFQRALDDMRGSGKEFVSSSEALGHIKRDLLERLIDNRLLIQEARKKRLTVDPRVVEGSLKLVAAEFTPGRLEEELLKKGKTLETYRLETEESLLLNKLLKREVVERIAVSQEDLEKFYLEHRTDFTKPEEVRVRQIVTRTEEEAEALRKQIVGKGAAFEDFARKYSLGPEGAKGGDLGYFPRGRMPPAIEEACFSLEPNYVSKPVASPYGYHLFYLVDRKLVRELSQEEARTEIERRIVDERTKEAESYYIRTLRDKAKIDRDSSLLDRVH